MNTITDVKAAVNQHREWMNQGLVDEHNQAISDRYFGVFCLGEPGQYETYNAQEIRQGNVDANLYYRQQVKKIPHWGYTDFAVGMRGNTECVVSSVIDFTLDGESVMLALVMEVYALEDGRWVLVRQYMEKHRPTE
jgi:hypothetical protein